MFDFLGIDPVDYRKAEAFAVAMMTRARYNKAETIEKINAANEPKGRKRQALIIINAGKLDGYFIN